MVLQQKMNPLNVKCSLLTHQANASIGVVISFAESCPFVCLYYLYVHPSACQHKLMTDDACLVGNFTFARLVVQYIEVVEGGSKKKKRISFFFIQVLGHHFPPASHTRIIGIILFRTTTSSISSPSFYYNIPLLLY